MTLVEDTGECFIRSMGEADRDRHTVAYWRFEDRTIGQFLSDTGRNVRQLRATVDSSYNGNDLYAFLPSSQPRISGDVPVSTVPQTGALNRGCLDNSRPPDGGMNTRDVYTHSAFSHAAPLDIQAITPAQWTIEASVKPARLRGGCQTFIVRDPTVHWPHVSKPVLTPARLTFQINAADRIAIRFYDVDDRLHEAVAEDLPLAEEHWYHAAAASDGRTLRLYVDALDGRGYLLRAATALPESGSTALGKGNDRCEWAIGRGRADGGPREWFQGWIDEVRISDMALEPAEFLFTPKDQGQVNGNAKR